MPAGKETEEAGTILSGFERNASWWMGGLIGVLLVAIFCVWPGMLSKPFTDDIFQLEKSAGITTWTGIFQPDAFNFFRPVKNAIFMLAGRCEGNLLAWHWIGLSAYLAAAVGVFKITSICLASKRAALIATAIWVLSPSCVSTAIWLSCANISIGVVFAACVFHFHERAAERPSAAAVGWCVVFYALSLFCYEALIAVPGLLFLRDLQQKRVGLDRATVVRYGIYTLVALGFMVLRHQFSAKSFGAAEFHASFAPDTKGWQLSLSAPWFLWRHFLMWVFPFGNIEILGSYGWMRSTGAAGLVFGWVFLVVLLGLAAAGWRRFPEVSLGILFFVVASVPAGNFLPGFNGPINDAYLTIPSIGLAMALSAVCERLIRKHAAARRMANFVGPAIVVVLAILLVYRLPICAAYYRFWAETWSTPVKLVLLMSETRPFQYQSTAYASVLLFEEGYIDKAEELAGEAIGQAPWNTQAKLTHARIAEYRKDYRQAEGFYRSILKTSHVADTMKETAMIELAGMFATLSDRKEEAAVICREALTQQSVGAKTQVKLILLLAKIYEDQRKPEKARATLERGLTFFPNNKEITLQLAALRNPALPAASGSH